MSNCLLVLCRNELHLNKLVQTGGYFPLLIHLETKALTLEWENVDPLADGSLVYYLHGQRVEFPNLEP